jgi:hypothetical protein
MLWLVVVKLSGDSFAAACVNSNLAATEESPHKNLSMLLVPFACGLRVETPANWGAKMICN